MLPCTPPVTSLEPYEVKGLWFESTRGYVLHTHGPEKLAQLDRRMQQWQGVLLEPTSAQWYPEEALQRLLGVLRADLSDGSPGDFIHLLDEITVAGIGRFFRLALSVPSASFVLRKSPVFWRLLRRGPAEHDVEFTADRVRMRYRDFPYFDDENYRLMTVGTVRGLLRASGTTDAIVEVASHDRDSLITDVWLQSPTSSRVLP